MRKKVFVLFALVAILAAASVTLAACVNIRYEGDDIYSNQGVLYKVDGQFATVIGHVEGETYCKILPRIKDEGLGIDAQVTIIAENAFANAKIDHVEFGAGFENLTIYPNAFAGSTINNLEDFPYRNVTLMDNALAGIYNLRELSVRGDSHERGCYYIDEKDNGLYGVGENGEITLYLVPAARSAGEDYTVTADIVAPGAFSGNKSIKNVYVGANVKRICAGAFAGVKISAVTINQGRTAEIFVEDNAFEVDKDMRFYVPAKDEAELDQWIKLNDGEQFETLSGLIHPAGCTTSGAHIHGLSGDNAPATSYAGTPYEVTDASHYRIKIGETEYVLQYLFTTFSAR